MIDIIKGVSGLCDHWLTIPELFQVVSVFIEVDNHTLKVVTRLKRSNVVSQDVYALTGINTVSDALTVVNRAKQATGIEELLEHN